MLALLDVALEDTGSGGLIEAGSFQNMCGVDPVVGLAAHDMFSLGFRPSELELPYWILTRNGMSTRSAKGTASDRDGDRGR